jgi:hypothetical protein
VLSYNFSHKKPKKEDKPKSQKEQTTVAPTEEDKEPESKLLVGNRLDDNYQNSGKITKIVIPKLDLPTEYPSINNSRIVRFVHIASICTPAKEIVFINRHKIVAIKYSSKFIDKRKPQKPKSKFNWDF